MGNFWNKSALLHPQNIFGACLTCHLIAPQMDFFYVRLKDRFWYRCCRHGIFEYEKYQREFVKGVRINDTNIIGHVNVMHYSMINR